MSKNINIHDALPQELATDFIDDMPVCFSFWTPKLEAVYCNKAYIKLFDLEDVDEYRLRHTEFSPNLQPCGKSSSELGDAYIQQTLKDGKCTFNWTHKKKCGELIPTEVTLAKVMHKGEAYLACYLTDLRSSIAKEKKIEQGNKHIQFMLDTMPLATQTWSKDFKLIDCSWEMVRMFGCKNEAEFIENFHKFNPEKQPCGSNSAELAQSYLVEAFEQGYVHVEWQHQNTKKEIIPCDVRLFRTQLNNEPVVIAYLINLSVHYQQIQKIRTAEEYNRILLDANPFGTLIWNDKFELVGVNKALAKIYGLNEAHEFIDNFLSLIPEFQPNGGNSIEKMYQCLQECYETGNSSTYWVGQDLNGNLIPTEVTVVRVMHHDKYVIAGYLKDLREIEFSRKKAQAAEEFSSAMLDGVPLGIAIWNNQFQVMDCNHAIVEFFGASSKEEFLKNVSKIVPEVQPDGSNSFLMSRQKFIEAWNNGVSSFEVYGRHWNGELLPIGMKLMRAKANEDDIFVGYMQDLRPMKENIKHIEEAEARVSAIIDAAPLCINLFDKNMQLLQCNQIGWELFGFKSSQDFADNFHKLFPEYQPDGKKSLEMVAEQLEKTLREGSSRIRTVTQTVEGVIIPCDVILKRAIINGEILVISYVQDLREINAALDAAYAATSAAEKSAQIKSDFLANMSHEIRTPMNGILGLLHILSHTELNASQKDYLSKAVFSANNLMRIINDILDFSKIEAGKLEIENIPFNLNEICDELHSLFMPKLKEKNIIFSVDEGEFSKETILGDPIRLKQVLLNLVGNAIKFTHTGQVRLNIEASVKNKNELHCMFKVKDTGIGLNSEQIKNLFSAFTQADTSVTRKYGGTGLGLVISKRIVKMMQGDIWAESNPGEGSTFTFTAIFKLASGDEIANNDISVLDAPTEEYQNRNAHLLLVEDNAINQIIAEELLKSVGYTIDIANNGQEALDMLEQKHYDLVLMDIQMPVMDGLTASRKIREIAKFKTLPIVAMSAHAMTGDKEVSLKNGMNDHITKPISPSILYKTLDHWLSVKLN